MADIIRCGLNEFTMRSQNCRSSDARTDEQRMEKLGWRSVYAYVTREGTLTLYVRQRTDLCCEECKKTLTTSDLESYWDGSDPHEVGCIPKGSDPIPRVCADCAEKEG